MAMATTSHLPHAVPSVRDVIEQEGSGTVEGTTTPNTAAPAIVESTDLPAAVVEERAAIAREVHVGLAQSASAVLLGLDILRSTALESSHVELERLERLARRNGREVRRLMAFLLAPREKGLRAAVQDYVDDIEADDSPVTFTIDEGAVDPSTGDRAFRFIHRALAALERSGASGALDISVLPVADDALLVRIDAAEAGDDGGRSLQGVASEAGGAPVVVRVHEGRVQLEAVIR